jgi:hypothetical protein
MKALHRYDFKGSDAWRHLVMETRRLPSRTFSIGIFQWKMYQPGKWSQERDRQFGKKGKRFDGLVENPLPTIQRAQEYCDQHNAALLGAVMAVQTRLLGGAA